MASFDSNVIIEKSDSDIPSFIASISDVKNFSSTEVTVTAEGYKTGLF